MKENKIFSIFNNNTMEELALKVEEIDLLANMNNLNLGDAKPNNCSKFHIRKF